jgi:hypothetical protein
VYGHPGHGIAYIVPAKQISQDIEKRFGSPISLALTAPATSGYPKPLDTLKPQVIPGNTAPEFGICLADITIVAALCRAIYRRCSDAGGEYDEIRREIRGLDIVLKHLKYEVEAVNSPLNSDLSIWRQAAPIVGDIDFTLRQLDRLLQHRFGANTTSQPPIRQRDQMAQLGAIRVKLISQKTSLNLFLDALQLHQSGKITENLGSSNSNLLDVILDTVDSIALRMGQSPQKSADEKEVWKQYLEELYAEGFSAQILVRHNVSQLPASNIQ